MRRSMLRLSLALVLLPAALAAQRRVPAALATDAARLRELDRFIERGMRDWEVPGLSISVVHGDSVVFARGYGVRRLGAPGAVDERTLFGIMSTTKAMTAMALAMLVDDGRLSWNDPVTRWVPEFEMPEPYLTREIRVVDLLTHNSGLPNADLLWSRGDLTAPEIFARLRLLTPAYPLRGGFAYHNVMYGVAGEVVARASGLAYGEFLRRRIFGPLGMTHSYPSLARMAAAGDGNRSTPHYRIQGRVQPIEDESVDVLASAGAVWSTAEDMGLWVRFLLDSAEAGGHRLVSDSGYRMLFAPQAIIPADEFYPTQALTHPHWMTYGLGWFEQDYRGHFIAFHTGSLDGRTAIVGLLPDKGLGVCVLGNLDHAEFRHAVMLKLFDLFLGGARRDWSGELLSLYHARPEDRAATAIPESTFAVAGAPASLALERYAGSYRHPVWGDVRVERARDGLDFWMGSNPGLRGPLLHLTGESFRLALGDGRNPPVVAQFVLDSAGAVAGLRIAEVADGAFMRLP